MLLSLGVWQIFNRYLNLFITLDTLSIPYSPFPIPHSLFPTLRLPALFRGRGGGYFGERFGLRSFNAHAL